jgi:hypothetical protein
MEVSGKLYDPSILHPGEKPPGTHWIRGWVDFRAGLDAVAKRKKIPASAGNRTPILQLIA